MAAESGAAALAPDVVIGVVGAGAMGAGIAQVAATAGHRVQLFDVRPGAAQAAVDGIHSTIAKLVSKGRLRDAEAIAVQAALQPADSLAELGGCGLVIEAIVEDLEAKREVFRGLEKIVGEDALLATNTSSLSITAIGAGLRSPARFGGMHFFNPAPLMPLVEIISGAATAQATAQTLHAIATCWGKTPVYARSTPGFIVNRVARPFYAEALRVLNEGGADCATIDAVMREAGGFRMGPFELMDLIGNDINYAVTRSVFEAFFGDPRFTPSLRQRELVEAGYLGRKTGRGFYNYAPDAAPPVPAHYAGSPAPRHLCLYGDDRLGRVLRERLPKPDFAIDITGPHPEGRIARCESFMLFRTDGRTATQRAADIHYRNVVLVDLALDVGHPTRIALTAADQSEPGALARAAGLLHAAGISVSPIGDIPGMIVMRTVAMLANEAADAVQQGVCSAEDCDLAMRKGVNYPSGPLAWADALGAHRVVQVLDHLAQAYGEDRYRVSPLLRRKAITRGLFHAAAPPHDIGGSDEFNSTREQP